MYRGFTPDNLFCFFNTNKGVKFVRTNDISSPCTLANDISAVVTSNGNSYILKGFIDKHRRKYFKWGDSDSIEDNS